MDVFENATLTIVDGSEAFYEEIQQLCDERYGSRYIGHSDYTRWMEHPKLLKIALMNDEFAGFAVMLPATVHEIMQHMDMPEADVLRIAGDKPILIYKSAAVQPRFERRGIMKALATEGLREARALGYGSLFGSAWVHNGSVPIERTFHAFGFQRLYERHRLWYNDENYYCIVCKGRCICDAVIYYKKLWGEDS